MQLSYEIETKIRDIIKEVTEPAIIKVSSCLQTVNKLKIRFQQIDLKLDASNQQISQLNLGLQMKFSELDSGIQKIMRIENAQAEKDVQFNQDQFEFKQQIDKIMNELKGYEESIRNQQSKFNHFDEIIEEIHTKMDSMKLTINAQIWKNANDQHQFQVTERNYIDEIKENVAMLLQANTLSRQETKEIQKKFESYNLLKNKLLKIDESKLQIDHKLDIKDFVDYQEQMNLQLEETKSQITSQLHEFSQEQQDTQQQLYVSVESKIKDNRVELKKEIDINKLKANDQYGNSILQLQKSFKEIKANLEVDQNSRLNAKDVQRMIQTLKDEMDDQFYETNRELQNIIRQQESQIRQQENQMQDQKNREIEEIHQHQEKQIMKQIKEQQIEQIKEYQEQSQPQQIDAAQLVSLKQDILQHTEYAIKKALNNYENQLKEIEFLKQNKKSLSIESIEIPKSQNRSKSIQNLQIVQSETNLAQFSDYDRRLDDMTIQFESNDVKLQLIQEYLMGVSQMIQGKAVDMNKERMNYFLENDEQSMEQFLSVKNRIYQLELFCRSKTNEYDNQYNKFTSDKAELIKQIKDFESMVLNTYVRRVEEQMMLYERANNQISKIKSDHSNENDYNLKQMDILQKKNQKIIVSEQNIMNYMVQMQNTIKLLYSVALQNEYVANKHPITQSFSSINDGFLYIYAPKCSDEKLFFTYKSQRVNKSEALALQLKEILSEPINDDLEQKRGTVNLPRLGETKQEKVSIGKNPNESGQNFKKVNRREFSTDTHRTNIMDFFSEVKSPEVLRNKKPLI